jgi:hypothetical protein
MEDGGGGDKEKGCRDAALKRGSVKAFRDEERLRRGLSWPHLRIRAFTHLLILQGVISVASVSSAAGRAACIGREAWRVLAAGALIPVKNTYKYLWVCGGTPRGSVDA